VSQNNRVTYAPAGINEVLMNRRIDFGTSYTEGTQFWKSRGMASYYCLLTSVRNV